MARTARMASADRAPPVRQEEMPQRQQIHQLIRPTPPLRLAVRAATAALVMLGSMEGMGEEAAVRERSPSRALPVTPAPARRVQQRRVGQGARVAVAVTALAPRLLVATEVMAVAGEMRSRTQ